MSRDATGVRDVTDMHHGRQQLSPTGGHRAPPPRPDDLGWGFEEPPTGGPGAGFQFNPLSLLRYKMMILLVALVGAGLTIPVIWLTGKITYEASAVVEIQPYIRPILYKSEETGAIPFYQSYLSTQVSVIRSSYIVNNVLDDVEVQKTDWYDEKETGLFGKPAPLAETRLLDGLSVSPIRGTHVIKIGFEAKKPRDAKLIVDKVLYWYKELARRNNEDEDKIVFDTLGEERKRIQSEITALSETRNAYSKGQPIASLETTHTQLTTAIFELETKRNELSDERDSAVVERASIKAASNDQVDQDVPDPVEGSAAEEATGFDNRYLDADWLRFRSEVSRLEEQLETESARLGESHPKLQELHTRLRFAEQRQAQREEELKAVAGHWTPEGVEAAVDPAALESRIGWLSERIVRLNTEIAEKRAVQQGTAETLGKLIEIEDSIRGHERKLSDINQRIEVLDLQSKAPGRVKVLSNATMPSEPARDRRVVFSAMAVFGWLGVGVGLAFLRVVLDRSFVEPSEVTAAVQVPFLGQLPLVHPGANMLEACDPLLQENMRMIRTSLVDRARSDRGFAVMITSPGPQTGKTTFALMLAQSLGQLKRKVLVVDLDLRRMGMSHRLDLVSQAGVIELLRGTRKQDEVVVHPEAISVDAIAAGQRVALDDPELLANGAFAACLAAWRERYEFVILDAPPVLPVADARMITGQVDGTILTVRASKTPRNDALDALSILNDAGGRLVGTVLNGVKHRLGRYAEYSGYYDDYRDRRLAATHSGGGNGSSTES